MIKWLWEFCTQKSQSHFIMNVWDTKMTMTKQETILNRLSYPFIFQLFTCDFQLLKSTWRAPKHIRNYRSDNVVPLHILFPYWPGWFCVQHTQAYQWRHNVIPNLSRNRHALRIFMVGVGSKLSHRRRCGASLLLSQMRRCYLLDSDLSRKLHLEGRVNSVEWINDWQWNEIMRFSFTISKRRCAYQCTPSSVEQALRSNSNVHAIVAWMCKSLTARTILCIENEHGILDDKSACTTAQHCMCRLYLSIR